MDGDGDPAAGVWIPLDSARDGSVRRDCDKEQTQLPACHGGTLRLKKPDIKQICQAGSCLLCVLLDLRITSGLGESEFSGGWLTGPLLSMDNIGNALFILSIVLTFVVTRVAAVHWACLNTALPAALFVFYCTGSIRSNLRTRT